MHPEGAPVNIGIDHVGGDTPRAAHVHRVREPGVGQVCDANLQLILSALPGFVSDVVGAVARVGHLVGSCGAVARVRANVCDDGVLVCVCVCVCVCERGFVLCACVCVCVSCVCVCVCVCV